MQLEVLFFSMSLLFAGVWALAGEIVISTAGRDN